ncbi:MAG: NAD(P)-dependent oxidoreductase [Bryobacteraceae bacterium]
MATKRVFVTGASGRIGREVVPLLLAQGYEVRAQVHSKPLPDAWASAVEAVHVDLLDEKAIAEAVGGVDAICHLAALMPPNTDDDIFKVNIESTFRLLQVASRQTVKPRMVFASSDATYCTGWSMQSYTTPIPETSEQHPTNTYGVSKVVGEKMCFHLGEIHKIPVVFLRLVWILEPRELLDLFVGAPYKEFLLPEDVGKWDDPAIVKVPLEETGVPFLEHVCDARDAAAGVTLALTHPHAAGETFNIAGPASFHYTEVGPWLAAKLGVEAIAGRCSGIHSYEVSLEKARRILGYQPKFSVRDSLEEALVVPAKA